MHRIPSSVLLAAALAMLAGCVTMGTTTGPSVGPGSAPAAGALGRRLRGRASGRHRPGLRPRLPEDPDDYEKEDVWPELRRAEANRFAIALKQALQDTQVFGDVRVSPDTEATGDLYVMAESRNRTDRTSRSRSRRWISAASGGCANATGTA